MDLNATLDAMKEAQANGSEALAKAYTQATGLVAYDLQAPALALYPFLALMTMLRNEIPRVGGGGDTATRWKAITGINTTNTHPGVSEGNRGGLITTTTANYLAAYAGFGLEDTVSFESDYASQGFDDVKARARLGLLRSLMLSEEGQILGGNASLSLGTTPTPVPATATTGGTIAAATYNVACVALTHQGASRSSLANGVVGLISKTNVDGSTDTINGGAAQKSATASQVTTGATSTISATVPAVEGAVAYAWYVGTAGAERLEAITSINSVLLTSLNGTRQLLSALTAADYSKDAVYNIDGLLSFAKAANNATVLALPTGVAGTGSTLTSDGGGGILEINNLLQTMFDAYRLGPQELLVSSAGIRLINKLCLSNGGAPLFRFNLDGGGQAGIAAGATVGSYLNPITNQLIRVRVHPNMPAGTILGYCTEIPYPLNGVGNVMQVKTRREYYSIDWPIGIQGRKFPYGVYCDEVLQHYAPFSMFKLYNVAGA
jgi:hypothetical protein